MAIKQCLCIVCGVVGMHDLTASRGDCPGLGYIPLTGDGVGAVQLPSTISYRKLITDN